jgi:hypothetical protein
VRPTGRPETPLAARAKAALAALAAAAGLGIGGCGEEEAASPLDAGLRYLPEDAPVAVAIATDVEGPQFQALGQLVERFPSGDQLVEGLRAGIEAEGVDFEQQVAPLLGNEFVVGIPTSEALAAEEDEFVAAIQVDDAEALRDLIESGGAAEAGEARGATL